MGMNSPKPSRKVNWFADQQTLSLQAVTDVYVATISNGNSRVYVRMYEEVRVRLCTLAKETRDYDSDSNNNYRCMKFIINSRRR